MEKTRIDPLIQLESRFARAAKALGANADSSILFRSLVDRYADPRRRYHDLSHVEACLRLLDRFRLRAERPAEVELALWFHDAIYEPSRNDNEARSGALAAAGLAALGAARGAIDRVVEAIEATRGHDAESGDAALVVDLDLAILGAPPEVFRDFERRIRQEYAHVPEDLFRAGRRAVLSRFLTRPRIYRVPPIAAEREAQARRNLAAGILALDSGAD
ncbi:MAG: N-methyl-D-aspartate receptor NMDAR2C subunit [Myxococcota bacterium]